MDALVRDATPRWWRWMATSLAGSLGEAAKLLGLVAGQDVEAGEDGMFRIAQRVARDRLISTVVSRPATGTSHGRAPSTATRATSVRSRR